MRHADHGRRTAVAVGLFGLLTLGDWQGDARQPPAAPRTPAPASQRAAGRAERLRETIRQKELILKALREYQREFSDGNIVRVPAAVAKALGLKTAGLKSEPVYLVPRAGQARSAARSLDPTDRDESALDAWIRMVQQAAVTDRATQQMIENQIVVDRQHLSALQGSQQLDDYLDQKPRVVPYREPAPRPPLPVPLAPGRVSPPPREPSERALRQISMEEDADKRSGTTVYVKWSTFNAFQAIGTDPINIGTTVTVSADLPDEFIEPGVWYSLKISVKVTTPEHFRTSQWISPGLTGTNVTITSAVKDGDPEKPRPSAGFGEYNSKMTIIPSSEVSYRFKVAEGTKAFTLTTYIGGVGPMATFRYSVSR